MVAKPYDETVFETPIELSKLNVPAGTAVRVDQAPVVNDALFARESKSFIKNLSWPKSGGSEPKGEGSTK
jgi:hypothetical protein